MLSPANFNDALILLSRHDIDFIVVGGVAALAHGAPLHTDDLDLVYDPSAANIARLLDVLGSIRARYRDPAGRHIVPDASKLAAIKIHLLETDLGHLDLLQSIGKDLGYHDLLDSCLEIQLEGHTVRVIKLETLIEAKMVADRPKDRATLPILRQLLTVVRRRRRDL